MRRSLQAILIIFLATYLSGCDKGITITMYHEINPGTLKRGKTDKLGQKQGTFYAQWEDSLKIDTYKDNVLNGYFCHYDNEGNILEEGFYKDGLLDSLFIEYHPGSGVKSRCNYSNGKRHGVYYEYYPSHILKKEGSYLLGKKEGEFVEYDQLMNITYKGSFHNDTLIGDELRFYENGIVKSIHNSEYKDFKEYDSIGRIISYSIEKNGTLSQMDFPPRPQSNILNNDSSSIIVDEIFSNYYEIRDGREPMWTGRSVSLIDDAVNITFNGGHPAIDNPIPSEETVYRIKNGEIEKGEYEGTRNMALDYYLFDVNKIRHINPKDDHNGVVQHSLSAGQDTTIKFDVFDVTVHSQRERIPGTGFNPISIQHKGKTIEMEELFDVTLFLYDGDHNGENELYVISSTKAFGLIQIYRVRTNS